MRIALARTTGAADAMSAKASLMPAHAGCARRGRAAPSVAPMVRDVVCGGNEAAERRTHRLRNGQERRQKVPGRRPIAGGCYSACMG